MEGYDVVEFGRGGVVGQGLRRRTELLKKKKKKKKTKKKKSEKSEKREREFARAPTSSRELLNSRRWRGWSEIPRVRTNAPDPSLCAFSGTCVSRHFSNLHENVPTAVRESDVELGKTLNARCVCCHHVRARSVRVRGRGVGALTHSRARGASRERANTRGDQLIASPGAEREREREEEVEGSIAFRAREFANQAFAARRRRGVPVRVSRRDSLLKLCDNPRPASARFKIRDSVRTETPAAPPREILCA